MRYSLAAVALVSATLVVSWNSSINAAELVIWDGTTGTSVSGHAPTGFARWEEANWTKGEIPGQTALATMGDNTGGRGGLDIVIGGGAKVFHDFNRFAEDEVIVDTDGLGDFQPRMDQNGTGSLTIKEGAVLLMDAHTDSDGRWVRHGINMNLDNGTLQTTFTPALCPPVGACSQRGGSIIFGQGNQLLPDTKIEINLTNGGRIDHDGRMTFGHIDQFWETPIDDPTSGHNPGIEVAVTINNGTIDLHDSNPFIDFGGLLPGELTFIYEYIGPQSDGGAPVGPKNEKYSINFTGPGEIIVDNGIFVLEQIATQEFLTPPRETPNYFDSLAYEDLWTLGILQANGVSGLTPGESFSTYFTTSGTPGQADYTLTSLVTPGGLDGDHNGDGVVDAADYVTWRKLPSEYGDAAGYDAWHENFGSSAPGGGSAVPEPGCVAILGAMLAGIGLGYRRVGRA